MEQLSLFFEPVHFFLNPQKRIYWLYWASALLFAYFILLKQQKTPLKESIQRLFAKRYWINHSSRVDVQWLFTNHALRSLLVVPLLGGQIGVAMVTFRGLQHHFGSGDFFAWPPIWTHTLFTVVLFLMDDASRCLLHWSYHKVPFLWRFHAIHHSASSLTPLTLYRIHPVEMTLNSVRSLWVIGSISGLFMYLFEGSISIISVAGVSIFTGAFHLLGANLRHSHVWIGFGYFERWFISPAQHQIHHSMHRKHWDKNYGASLAIWDRMIGSWLPSEKESVEKFGVQGVKKQSFLRQWLGL